MSLDQHLGGGSPSPLDAKSRDLRRTMVEMMRAANRGHLASALSLVEILRVLYEDVLRYDPAKPQWRERDRCILSKGHGALALYAVLQDRGFFPQKELWKFCQADGMLGGHPEVKVPGVEASTGSLGHGLPIGVGLALSARYDDSARRVFVIVGDGECNEGSVWEAALCAAKHRLSNLTVIVDYNHQQSYGSTHEVLELEPFEDKWRSFGFAACSVCGHDLSALRQVFSKLPLAADQPSSILCHTVKGKGIAIAEGDLTWHHKSRLSDADIQALDDGLRG